MKNLRMSTVITAIISVVAAVCILLLFVTASRSMMMTMRDTAVDNMQTSLEDKSAIIEEYVDKAEKLLIAYSKAPVVGITTREGDSLKQLQDAMIAAGDLYNQFTR